MQSAVRVGAGSSPHPTILFEPCVFQWQADPEDDEVTLVLPGREVFDDSQPDMGEPFDPVQLEAGWRRSHCTKHKNVTAQLLPVSLSQP